MSALAMVGTRVVVGLGLLFVLLSGSLTGAAADRSGERPRVLVTRVDTSISPVVADHVDDALAHAASGHFDAYVITLDTPGGLVTSMRGIVEDILASPVPVVVYVSPEGARAASAGAIITFASHVAVMAPGTSIGAATPVGLEGGDVSTKVVNDAAAQAKSLAQLRGRNVAFAVSTVRKGRSASVEEALQIGAVDAIAGSLATALKAAHGQTVTVSSDRHITVQTANAVLVRDDLGLFQQVLQFLANPNIAFVLLVLATLGLIVEFATPGIGLAGATGAVSFVLAMFGLSVLPINVVGVLLLALAAVLFVAELFAPGVAGFALAGAVVLVLAALFLFDDVEGVSVDPMAAVPTAVVAGVAAVLAGRVTVRTRKMASTASGPEMFHGRTVTVREAEGATGRTFTEGAWWSLRSTGPPLRPGDRARVVGLDGLVMVVEPRPPEHQLEEEP